MTTREKALLAALLTAAALLIIFAAAGGPTWIVVALGVITVVDAAGFVAARWSARHA